MGGKRFNSLDTTSAFSRPGTIFKHVSRQSRRVGFIMRFLTNLTRRLHFWRISGLLAADMLLFGTTDPRSTLSFMLIVGFLLLSATIYYLLDGVLAFLRLYGLAPANRKRVLRTATMVVCGILALQSMGQLSLRDLMIAAPLVLLGYFYLAYSKGARRRTASSPDAA